MALQPSHEDVGLSHLARRHGERLGHGRALDVLARAGLATRGVVYAIIGVLALKLALGDGGRTTSQQGALRTIADRPFGTVLLTVVAIGLAGYALWRLARAAIGHGREQDDSAFDRVAGAAAGISYGVLCATAVGILAGSGSGSGSPKHATAGVLGWTGGPVLVTLAGLVLIGVAGYQGYKGVARTFLDSSKTEQMREPVRTAFTALGVVGHVARAVVFALIGYGLVHAALAYDPQQAVGLDGALSRLARASYGPWLLGLVAAGLVGFAAYSIADARYRKT